jgi:zinc transport system substrate-binding protein
MIRRVLLLLLVLLPTGCRGPGEGDTDRLSVAVSIAPQAFLVEGIAGGQVDVFVVIPPGADPHSYEPSPATMRAISDADLYLTIGLPFEDQWLSRIGDSAPDLVVARIDSGIQRTADGDPHLWMSPSLMRAMASNTENLLERADPAFSESYRSGLESTLATIDSVDAAVRNTLEGMQGESFVALHPAYAYFAHDYGLVQIALEVEGAEPAPSELAEVVEAARASGSRVVIVSPGFSTGAAEALSIELGISPIPHDQLSRDWPAGMIELASIISGERQWNP